MAGLDIQPNLTPKIKVTEIQFIGFFWMIELGFT
jgi:hypothetical protein